MSAALARRSMPRRQDAPRDDVPVRVDAALVRDAKVIAAIRDISLAEYISEALRPIVARDLQEAHQELARRSKPQSPRSKRDAGERA